MKYLRQKEVCEMLRISDSSFSCLRATTDFPKGIKIGYLEVLVWVESEIHEWMMKQARKRSVWSD